MADGDTWAALPECQPHGVHCFSRWSTGVLTDFAPRCVDANGGLRLLTGAAVSSLV